MSVQTSLDSEINIVKYFKPHNNYSCLPENSRRSAEYLQPNPEQCCKCNTYSVAIVLTPVQGKTKMFPIKQFRFLLLDVIMNIAVVIYS